MNMLLRSVRNAFVAATRNFSAEATVSEKTTASKGILTKTRSGGGRDTLGRRLVNLIYPKRSAVIAIKKWKEEGHTVRKYELNLIIRELRSLKRYKHSLEICEWMKLQQDMKLLPGDYAVHLDLIGKVHGISSAEKFFENLPENMADQATYTALLHTYVRGNLITKAEALLAKMSECGFLKNPLPYNHMISLYISNSQLEKVPELILELKKNLSPDVYTYNLWLTACASIDDVETGDKVFLEMKKAKIDPDWITYSTLTNLYMKNSLVDKASCTLKEMEKLVSRKNRAAYSSLLSLYTNMGDNDSVHQVWKKMKSCFLKMNDSEYSCMISSMVKLNEMKEAENLYTEWESVSGSGDTRVSNIVLGAYINRNQMDKAESFFDRIVQKGIKPSYTTWELLTWGYLKQKQMDKVLDYFEKIIGSVRKWIPQERLVREVFKRLEEEGNVEGAEHFLVILRKAGHLNTEIYLSLLRTYLKAGKMPLIVAERMGKDNVTLDEEIHKLLRTTSKMCVSEVPTHF